MRESEGGVREIVRVCQDNRNAAAVSACCKAKEIETGVSATRGRVLP